VLESNDRTSLPVKGNHLTTFSFNPDAVRSVKLWFGPTEFRFLAIEITDTFGNVILKSGEFNSKYRVHQFKVEEGERLVGIVTANGGKDAYHSDLQFIIAKKLR
jgi:hypothetical protein